MKLAEHTGGLPVADPLAVNPAEDPGETERIEVFLAAHMPQVSRRRQRFATCLYTLSPARHFIIDRHPESSQVAVAAGLSGHGYTFASVLGEVLAGMGPGETPAAPIGFLALDRFARPAWP